MKMGVSTLHNQNFLSSLLKHHHFEHFQELECIPSSNNLVWICKNSHANTRCAWKQNGGCALNNVFLHPWNVFHSCTISTSRTSEKKLWKTMKNNGKTWKKQPWTLGYISILQIMSFPLSFIFGFGPIEFPCKLVPCRFHLNLASISIGLGSSSKGLGSNFMTLNQ